MQRHLPERATVGPDGRQIVIGTHEDGDALGGSGRCDALDLGTRDLSEPELRLLERIVAFFETREVEVVSEARLLASPMGARVRAVLARAGSQALVVWRAAE